MQNFSKFPNTADSKISIDDDSTLLMEAYNLTYLINWQSMVNMACYRNPPVLSVDIKS